MKRTFAISLGIALAASAPLSQADPVTDVLNGVLGPVGGSLPGDLLQFVESRLPI